MKRFFFGLIAFTLTACTASVTNQIPVNAPANNLVSIRGPDAHVELVSRLAEAFVKIHPDAQISVTGGTDDIGIAALIRGEISLANAARKITAEEQKSAVQNNRSLQEFVVARMAGSEEPVYQYVAGTPGSESTLGQFLQFEASPEAKRIIETAGYHFRSTADETRNHVILNGIQ